MIYLEGVYCIISWNLGNSPLLLAQPKKALPLRCFLSKAAQEAGKCEEQGGQLGKTPRGDALLPQDGFSLQKFVDTRTAACV